MYCLDSAFCTDLLNGVPSAGECLKSIGDSQARLAIAAPALTEFLVGAHVKGGRRLASALELAAQLETLDVTTAIALEAARIGGECYRRGSPVGNVDLIIAATAMQHHATLVTRYDDFSRIPGLATQSY